MTKLIKKPFIPVAKPQFAALPTATLTAIINHDRKKCTQHIKSKMLKTKTTIIWPNGDATHRIVNLNDNYQVAVFIRKSREALQLGGQILINKLET